MLRAKIILPNLLVVCALGFLSYFIIDNRASLEAEERLIRKIEITGDLLNRSDALRGHEILTEVRRQAMIGDITQAFRPSQIQKKETDTQEIFDKQVRENLRTRSVKAVELSAAFWAEAIGMKPAFVFLVDKNGVVITRSTTPNACPTGYNVTKAMSVVEKSLDGSAAYSVWSLEASPFGKVGNKSAEGDALCSLMGKGKGLMEMAAAPVWIGDDIEGSLVVGFEISNGISLEKSKKLDLDIAILTNGKIYSSSFEDETTRQSLDAQLKDVAKDQVQSSIKSSMPSKVFSININGIDYFAKVLPVNNADAEEGVANVLLGAKEQAKYFKDDLFLLVVLTIVALGCMLMIGIILSSHLRRPVVEIEEGLLKIINGEYDYRFEVKSSEVGGLGYRINQLVGELTGEDEEEGDK